MLPEHSSGAAPFRASVYRWPLRLVIAALRLASALGLIATLVILLTNSQVQLPVARALFEARLLATLSLAPYLVAQLLQRLCAVRLETNMEVLAIVGSGLRIDIPRASVLRLEPWTVPLPRPGFWLAMRSGARLAYGIEPHRMEEALKALAFVDDPAVVNHPLMAYAVAAERVRWRWYHLVFKFGVFPLLPGLLIFRLHQFITFGGTFGEYYLAGLAPYLTTLAVYLGSTSMDCVLWASVWRGLGEASAYAGVWLAPASSSVIRRMVELACSVLYYGGILSMIAYAILH